MAKSQHRGRDKEAADSATQERRLVFAKLHFAFTFLCAVVPVCLIARLIAEPSSGERWDLLPLLAGSCFWFLVVLVHLVVTIAYFSANPPMSRRRQRTTMIIILVALALTLALILHPLWIAKVDLFWKWWSGTL